MGCTGRDYGTVDSHPIDSFNSSTLHILQNYYFFLGLFSGFIHIASITQHLIKAYQSCLMM